MIRLYKRNYDIINIILTHVLTLKNKKLRHYITEIWYKILNFNFILTVILTCYDPYKTNKQILIKI